jgi:hypothetical protein
MSLDPQPTDRRDAPELRDVPDIEAEHRRAQDSGAVFDAERTVQHHSWPGRSSTGRPLVIV